MINMNKLYLSMHLGLGDALICNGLIRTLIEHGRNLVIPVWKKNRIPITLMLADVFNKLEIIEMDERPEDFAGNHEYLKLGYAGDNFNASKLDESFYEQAGIPFENKFTKFKLPFRIPPRIYVNKFIADDPGRDYVIPVEGYRPYMTGNIFDHLPELMGADEIHCPNSAFYVLADLIKAPGDKFLHTYCRTGAPHLTTQCNWKHINE